MRLPASVLGTLRMGLGATALVAAACDSDPTEPAETVTAPAPTITARELEEEVVPEAPAPGLAAEVNALVERAGSESNREVVAALESNEPASAEDATAFVPFSEDPATAAPIRPRIRPRARPRRPARVRPTETKPVEVRSPWTRPRPEIPKWDSDPCPACGRG